MEDRCSSICPPVIIHFPLAGSFVVQSQFSQANIEMKTSGFELQHQSISDLLAMFFGVRNTIVCATYCNQKSQCHHFDYDTSTKICRIFLDGSIVVSSSTTSQVGSVRFTPNLYASYGQLCASNNCRANRYLICSALDTCQCTIYFFWNTSMCVGQSLSKQQPFEERLPSRCKASHRLSSY